MKKIQAAGNQLVSVVTANSVSRELVTELIVVTEITQGKKKVRDTVTLRAEAFFQVPSMFSYSIFIHLTDAGELWESFTKSFKPIKFVQNVDAFSFNNVRKIEVRFEDTIENVIIFKDHFIHCEKAQEVHHQNSPQNSLFEAMGSICQQEI